jgi:hypothetical protein
MVWAEKDRKRSFQFKIYVENDKILNGGELIWDFYVRKRRIYGVSQQKWIFAKGSIEYNIYMMVLNFENISLVLETVFCTHKLFFLFQLEQLF